MFFKNKHMIKIFQIVITIIMGVLFLDCDFNIFKPNQAPQIDSLYVMEQTEYIFGDTLHLVCEAHDSKSDALFYFWQNSAGILIQNYNKAILISESDSIVNVNCTVSDEYGDSVNQSIEVKFSLNPSNYFPTSIGNIWTFDSKFNYVDICGYSSIYNEGTETWEIKDYRDDTLTLQIDFEGVSGTDTEVEYMKIIKLYRDNGLWRISGAFDKIFHVAGYRLIFKRGIPYLFTNGTIDVRRTFYYEGRYNYFYWDSRYGVGPTLVTSRDNDGVTDDIIMEIQLKSYNVY